MISGAPVNVYELTFGVNKAFARQDSNINDSNSLLNIKDSILLLFTRLPNVIVNGIWSREI